MFAIRMGIMILTKEFISKIKTDSRPMWVIAQKIGLHPNRLSRIIHGEKIKRPHDIRFTLLATEVGFVGSLFEESITQK
jgi:hypothetical protein